MGKNQINNILIPNVSKAPGHKKVTPKEIQGDKDEFKSLLNQKIESEKSVAKDQHGINLSTHAARRLQERNLQLDSGEYFKLKGAMEKLKTKGGQDSLVITGKAAYIVDVPNNKIVTAIDKDNMSDNVFTKIDSTLVVN